MGIDTVYEQDMQTAHIIQPAEEMAAIEATSAAARISARQTAVCHLFLLKACLDTDMGPTPFRSSANSGAYFVPKIRSPASPRPGTI